MLSQQLSNRHKKANSENTIGFNSIIGFSYYLLWLIAIFDTLGRDTDSVMSVE